MRKEDIQPWDWHRILFGEAPPEFMLEVFLRTLIIYVALLIIVRLMGKRMGGQLTISEMAVMITLGAIISPAMQIPQPGILMGIMILVCALIFQRGLNSWEFKSGKFEEISQGTAVIAINDGIIQLDEMKRAKVSRQQLFAALRNQNVYNLGDIGRAYLEACGEFSIYKKPEPSPGLQIFPPDDPGINSFSQQVVEGSLACASCGNVIERNDPSHRCPVCNANKWVNATVSIQSQLRAL